MKPGDRVGKGVVKRTTPYGDCIVAFADPGRGTVEGLLRSLYAKGPRRQGESVTRLVVLPGAMDLPELAEDRYEKPLVDHFYSPGLPEGGVEARHPDTWVPRWREASRPGTSLKCAPSSASLPAPAGRRWWLVQSDGWLMPVTNVHHYEDCRPKQMAFCPAFLKRGHLEHVIASCYRRALTGEDFLPPLGYRGRLSVPGHPPRPVRVLLHGALYPLKLHYNVWKRMLSGTPKADAEEKGFWKEWLDLPLPEDARVREIFADCRENPGGTCCRGCSPEQFRRVHEEIKDLVRLYWRAVVTFWESPTNKLVTMASTGHEGCREVQIVSIGKEGRPGREFFPTIFLWGWTYDWEDGEKEEGEAPLLHLSVLTFFLQKRRKYRPKIVDSHACLKGRLENVYRASILGS